MPNNTKLNFPKKYLLLAALLALAGCGGIDPGSSTGTSPLGVTPTVTLADGGSSSTAGCSAEADTWANYGQGFFAANCTRCHSASGRSPNLSSHATVQAEASQLRSRITSGSMPPDGSLSATDVARIAGYLGCGAP